MVRRKFVAPDPEIGERNQSYIHRVVQAAEEFANSPPEVDEERLIAWLRTLGQLFQEEIPFLPFVTEEEHRTARAAVEEQGIGE